MALTMVCVPYIVYSLNIRSYIRSKMGWGGTDPRGFGREPRAWYGARATSRRALRAPSPSGARPTLQG